MGSGKLSEYRGKRDPRRTPEPVPSSDDLPEGDDDTFVIQEHHARRLHWDVRFERDGVLVSWAVPKGLPPEPGTVRLAVHTEDHPLEYAEFEGEIPKGEYGGGRVLIWDRGRYEASKWNEREVAVTMHGSRVRGKYTFFRTGDDWMVRRSDPPQEAGWEPLPKKIKPMLAVQGSLPPVEQDEKWAYEFKWDGVRALAHVEGGGVRLTSRAGNDITETYPELRELGTRFGAKQLLLDGEIVALEGGRPSFKALQARMHANAGKARQLSKRAPVTYLIFDVLQHDGKPLGGESYQRRREVLEALGLVGPHWHVSPSYPASGAAVVRAADEQGLEGVIAKRLASTYRYGRRSGDWLKITEEEALEVVIGGWRPGEGRRSGSFGSLLLGIPQRDGLRYIGHVGTGFTDTELDIVSGKVRRLERKTSPFVTEVPRDKARAARWVSPKLVGEVVFKAWTADGRLRAPSWRGLRPDRDPGELADA